MNGRGGDNRGNRKKPFKRRERENNQSRSRDPAKNSGKKSAEVSPIGEVKLDKKRAIVYNRPKWVPPQLPTEPLPAATCVWCEKPIKDISTAISEPNSGNPVHFDCVINRIVEREHFESGDTVSYIGGGRFGIIHFNNPPDTRDFKIKKILEWEDKENRSEWRTHISEYFSVT